MGLDPGIDFWDHCPNAHVCSSFEQNNKQSIFSEAGWRQAGAAEQGAEEAATLQPLPPDLKILMRSATHFSRGRKLAHDVPILNYFEERLLCKLRGVLQIWTIFIENPDRLV